MDNSLLALSPLDGRYVLMCDKLKQYFSEYAFFKYRLKIEIEYFIFLEKIDIIHDIPTEQLRNIYLNFNIKDCEQIKIIEQTTKHDVKAIEYFLQLKFKELNLETYIQFIHFGLTSQDINTSAIILSLKEATIFLKTYIQKLIDQLYNMAKEWKNIVMLSKTHGQPASPTLVGKELMVFVERLEYQIKKINNYKFYTKFGGAVGNYNAHYIAYPNINWIEKGNEFINSLELERHQFTTQIDHYDNISELLDIFKQISVIVLDLNVDMWLYISNNIFQQKINKNEIGSSTMPHKVNPINFENSEGNLTIAVSLLECISRKLPRSRLQRDLTDSTILRNLGSVFGYCLIGFKNTLIGLQKLVINETIIHKELNENIMVLSEAIQTILRREGIQDAYEQLKNLTRHNTIITHETLKYFIESLKISDRIKQELDEITIYKYIGKSKEF